MKYACVTVAVVFGVLASPACSDSTDGGHAGMDGGTDASADAAALPDVLDASASKDVRSQSESGYQPLEGSDADSGQEGDAATEAECHSSEPVLARLHGICYRDDRPCESYDVRARLFLDTRNSPFVGWEHQFSTYSPPFIILDGQCRIEGRTPPMVQIEFRYGDDETIDPDILPGQRYQPGWKVDIARAGFEYCETCSTSTGPLPEFWLRGSLQDVEFVRDLKDELWVFVEVRDADGNLVADIR